MCRNISLIILSLFLFACNGRDEESSITEPIGTMYVKSESGVYDSYTSLLASLNQNQDINIIEEVDFGINARSVDRDLGPSRIIFFGNPNMGTSLLQRNQLAALDLPQRVLLFEKDEESYAMYNSRQYLESRYQLQGVPELEEIENALRNMTNNATRAEVREAEQQKVSAGEGIITVESEQNFENTYRSLQEALIENNSWRVLREIDHSDNAGGVGMQLRPTRVFLISNPHLESSMLGNNPTAGLDFPPKMLVWEDENGTVKISYNDPDYIERRHNMSGSEIELGETATVFSDIAAYASQDLGAYDAPENTELEFDENNYPGGAKEL